MTTNKNEKITIKEGNNVQVSRQSMENYAGIYFYIKKKESLFGGFSINYHLIPLGNCQTGTIAGASALIQRLKYKHGDHAPYYEGVNLLLDYLIEEVKNNTSSIKNQLLIDVHTEHRDIIINAFKERGSVVVYNTEYTNKTGNSMSSILIDLVPEKVVDEDGSFVEGIEYLMEEYDYDWDEAESIYDNYYRREQDPRYMKK